MRVLSMFKGWAMTLAATSQIKHFLTERRAITKGKQLCFTDTHTHTHSCIFFLFFCDSLSPVYLLEFLCPSSLLHPRSHPVTDHPQLVVTKSPWCRLWNLQLVPTPFPKKTGEGPFPGPLENICVYVQSALNHPKYPFLNCLIENEMCLGRTITIRHWVWKMSFSFLPPPFLFLDS